MSMFEVLEPQTCSSPESQKCHIFHRFVRKVALENPPHDLKLAQSSTRREPFSPSGSARTTVAQTGSCRDADKRGGSPPPLLSPTKVQKSNPCRDEMEGYDGPSCGSRSTQVNHDTCKTPLRMPGMPQAVGSGRPRTEWFFEILLEQMTILGDFMLASSSARLLTGRCSCAKGK